MLGLLLISSRAMSAAGMAPDELNPNCPKEVMNMKVRLDWEHQAGLTRKRSGTTTRNFITTFF